MVVTKEKLELKDKVVRTIARSRPRDIFGELKTEEFYVSEKRDAMSERAKDALNQMLNPFGVLVERVHGVVGVDVPRLAPASVARATCACLASSAGSTSDTPNAHSASYGTRRSAARLPDESAGSRPLRRPSSRRAARRSTAARAVCECPGRALRADEGQARASARPAAGGGE